MGIEIVDTLERQRELEDKRQQYVKKFRDEVAKALKSLQEACGSFDQTTHVSLLALNYTGIRTICTALQEAYEMPRAFNISELSQCIDKFLQYEGHES